MKLSVFRFINNLIVEDFSLTREKIKSLIITFIEYISFREKIAYFLWIFKNRQNDKIICCDKNIKFAIVYFFEKELNKYLFNAFVNNLNEQGFKEFEIFIWRDGFIDELSKINKFSHLIFVEQGDAISTNALNKVAFFLVENKDAVVIYSDEDELGFFSFRKNPFFKPSFDPFLFLAYNYINALTCIAFNNFTIELLRNINNFNQIKLYELIFNLINRGVQPLRIEDILYHRIKRNKNVVMTDDYRLVLKKLLDQSGYNSKIVESKCSSKVNVVKFYPRNRRALVSIIIPFRDKVDLLRNCVNSIEKVSTYKNYEILLVDNMSVENDTKNYLASSKHKVIEANFDFNFSKINNLAANQALGQHLLFLNNDVEILTPDWIETTLSISEMKNVGAVGAQLLYQDETIQHSGIILVDNIAYHINRFNRVGTSCFGQYNNLIKTYSCVTGACMMVSKDKFNRVGGFDENLKVEWNDIDLCLNLQKAGYLNVYNPFSKHYHYEKKTRKDCYSSTISSEKRYFLDKWKECCLADRYHNINLSLRADKYRVRIY